MAALLDVPAKLPTPEVVVRASTALCKEPRVVLMSESVETADCVEVCFVFRALSRPESALTRPEMRLVVSMPDPTPLRLLVSAMIPIEDERPAPSFPQLFQRFLSLFLAFRALRRTT